MLASFLSASVRATHTKPVAFTSWSVRQPDLDQHRVKRSSTTSPQIQAIEDASKESGVHVVAVPIDYTENTRILVDELRAAKLVRSLEEVGYSSSFSPAAHRNPD